MFTWRGFMQKILLYSLLLIAGMIISQSGIFNGHAFWIREATMLCLAYIMMEVGLEFTIDKTKLSTYGVDCIVAFCAAALPWIFCAGYFHWMFDISLKDSLMIGLFAAPTSAGVLFTMLSAAGLSYTWVFQKARVLAIFDDLHTILLMIPLQIVFIGLAWDSLYAVVVILGLFACAYLFLHTLKLPASPPWLFFYGFIILLLLATVKHYLEFGIEVLLPAFAWGCILKNEEEVSETPHQPHHETLDNYIKAAFMFLVGCVLPPINLGEIPLGIVGLHVLALTILSNMGKLVPSLFYSNETSGNNRLALSFAMFPRGEVGAGVLLIAAGYGLRAEGIALGELSLALNLALTGLFILIAMKLIKSQPKAVQ